MKRTDPSKIQQDIFSSLAKVYKVAQAGLSWLPKGTATVAMRVDPSTPVMFFNNSSSVVFVKFAPTSTGIAAPTGPSDGLPVPANQTVVYNSGSNSYYISSSAAVYAYLPEAE